MIKKIIIIILVFVLLGCIAFFMHVKKVEQAISSQSVIIPDIGHLDDAPLETGSATPTITGTYVGDTNPDHKTASLGIVIINNTSTPPMSARFSDMQNKVVEAYSDHGGDVSMTTISATTSKFSFTVENPLPKGWYVVAVYKYYNNYDQNGYEGDTIPTLLFGRSMYVK